MTALHPGVTEATIIIRVAGRPAPQGSKTRTRFAMRDSNAATLHPWRDAVRSEVQRYVDSRRYREPGKFATLDGPVHLELIFTLPKPASAPKRRRSWPIKERSGDLDKLCRAACDGVTDGGLWVTDAQVVRMYAEKLFVGDPYANATPGAVISVTPITEDS